MQYKAIVSFSGKVNMVCGEVKELDLSIANDLLKAGYIIPLEADAKEKPKTKRKVKAHED